MQKVKLVVSLAKEYSQKEKLVVSSGIEHSPKVKLSHEEAHILFSKNTKRDLITDITPDFKYSKIPKLVIFYLFFYFFKHT